jgi:hypothetical protein
MKRIKSLLLVAAVVVAAAYAAIAVPVNSLADTGVSQTVSSGNGSTGWD